MCSLNICFRTFLNTVLAFSLFGIMHVQAATYLVEYTGMVNDVGPSLSFGKSIGEPVEGLIWIFGDNAGTPTEMVVPPSKQWEPGTSFVLADPPFMSYVLNDDSLFMTDDGFFEAIEIFDRGEVSGTAVIAALYVESHDTNWLDISQGLNQNFDLSAADHMEGHWHDTSTGDFISFQLTRIAYSLVVPVGDTDSDGVMDSADNCPNVSNPLQEDSDSDGIGDACDICYLDPSNDADGDGICGDVDVCPYDPNNDADSDGICGDVDACPLDPNNDVDGDGICGDVDVCPNDPNNDVDSDGICGDVDACPLDPNNDVDGDGVCGDVDNCPNFSNAGQEDTDRDGIGDACDTTGPPIIGEPGPSTPTQDDDGDGVPNVRDRCPTEGGIVNRQGCPI